MARTAEVIYVGDAESLIRASNEAAAANERATVRIEGSNKRISHSGTIAAAGIAAIGAAAYGVKKSADTLEGIAKETLLLHNVTGLAVKSASAYASVAVTQGLSAKSLNQAFGTLSKNVQAVDNAHAGLTKSAKTQENAFRLLHIPLSQVYAAHGDMNKLLPIVTSHFEQMKGGVTKTAAGMALFGKGWQTLVPLLHEGTLGLKEQLDTAKKMGATLSGSSTQQLKEFVKQQEDAKYASLGLQLAIGQDLAPALTKLIHFLADAAHALQDGIHWMREHEGVAKSLAIVIGVVLGGALSVYATNKIKAFIGATQAAMGAMRAFAASMGLVPSAAEVASAKTIAAQKATTTFIASSDGEIVAANEAAGKSFSAMLGPIGAVVAALLAAQPLITELTGGKLGEPAANDKSIGKIWEEQYGPNGKFSPHTKGKGGAPAGHIGEFSEKGFAQSVLLGLGAPASGPALKAMMEWIRQEGGNWHNEAKFNPLNTTMEEPGAGNTGSQGNIKAYKNWSQGLKATLATLKLPSYKQIVKLLQEGASAGKIEAAINASPWGTHFTGPVLSAQEAVEAEHASATKKAQAHARSTTPSSQQIETWAEEHIGKFAESTGKNTGPELDKLQAEFHTRAAAWCAEFATTAAMMGGANKAVRTASVATIREWATQGSHGFRKGVGHTPHVGDMMMFGNSHVGFVSQVDKQSGMVTTIEGNTGAGKVSRQTHRISEGDYASPIYGKITEGGLALKQMSSGFTEAMKAAMLKVAADEKTGKSALAQMLAAINSGSLVKLNTMLDKTHTQGLARIEHTLAADHSKSSEKLGRELVSTHALVLRSLGQAIAAQLAKWGETLTGVKEKMGELVSQAGSAWAAIQRKAIESGPHAAAIAGMRKEDEAEETRHTEASNKEALTAAQKRVKEAKGNENPEELKQAEKEVKAAEEAITRFARQQDEKRQEYAENVEVDALTARQTEYEAFLTRQLGALEGQLATAKVSYARFAASVNEILSASGIIYKPDKTTAEAILEGPAGGVVEYTKHPGPGESVHVGPGTPAAHKAAGGYVYAGVDYVGGESGAERFTPRVDGTITPASRLGAAGAGSMAAGVTFTGPVSLGSRRDADRLAQQLAHKLTYGSR